MMNTIDFNDPTLTAYALGELEGDEAAQIKARLAEDAQLRAVVDEIRHAAKVLSAEFAAEPALRLTQQQRQAIERRPQPATRSSLMFPRRMLWVGMGLAAAACLTIAVVVTLVNRSSQRDQTAYQGPVDQNHVDLRRRDQKTEFDRKQNGASDTAPLKEETKETEAGKLAKPEIIAPPSPTGAPSQGDNVLSSGQFRGAGGGGGGGEAGRRGGKDAPAADKGAGGNQGSNPPPGRIGPLTPPPALPRSDTADALRRMPMAPVQPSETRSARPERHIDPDEKFRNADDERAAGQVEDQPIVENEFLRAIESPLATFSIDVDTASYSNIRQYINAGQLPPKSSVRIEEMINYFPFSYEPPSGEQPFSATVEVNDAPWDISHRLLRIGLKGREIKPEMRSPTSLVFLLDVSGSMNAANKLPLVKQAMKLLVEKLNADDRLAIVTYAGSTERLLESMYCTFDNKPKILNAIESLHSGGSTNGESGINLAYQEAAAHFIKGGVNRVILCTDGDFNVGAASPEALIALIEKQRITGIFLSVMGFGTGNFKDQKMEQLADHGNGNYAYIDAIDEAKKVLIDQMGGTLETIAKDVKIQVDFNPGKVGKYRLIGYENRALAARDFANDKKDAGEIGAGHTVTALFEIVPADGKAEPAEGTTSRFLEHGKIIRSDLLLNLMIRYKEPAGDQSKLLEFPVNDVPLGSEKATADFQFAAAVASFGMILRDSPHKGTSTFQSVIEWATAGRGPDEKGYRAAFVELVEQARKIQ